MFLTIKLCTYAKLKVKKTLIYCIKIGLVLNNLQKLICPKTQTNKQPLSWLSCLDLVEGHRYEALSEDLTKYSLAIGLRDKI